MDFATMFLLSLLTILILPTIPYTAVIWKMKPTTLARFQLSVFVDISIFKVKLAMHSFTEFVPENPPESPLECCSKAATRPHCQSVCSGTTGIGKDIKPGRPAGCYLSCASLNLACHCFSVISRSCLVFPSSHKYNNNSNLIFQEPSCQNLDVLMNSIH